MHGYHVLVNAGYMRLVLSRPCALQPSLVLTTFGRGDQPAPTYLVVKYRREHVPSATAH